MCLFLEAAKAWQRLTAIEYRMTAGRKGKTFSFRLDFEAADFPHLAGMQYAKDADFGLHPSEYYGEKLMDVLLSGKMDGSRIEASRNWERIEGRLKAIIGLQETLDSDFLIAKFDPSKVPAGSRIDADYVIRNISSGETYFIFVDEDQTHRHYCKSAFAVGITDYLRNQPQLTMLKKEKTQDGQTQILYRHPNFVEQPVAPV